MIADLPVFPYVIEGGIILAVICGVPSVAAVIAGFIRRQQIKPPKAASESEPAGSDEQSASQN